MTPEQLAWRAEETCLNAWPALRQVLLNDWVLRFSEGLTRRANSVNPLRGPRETGGGMIAACEALYQRRGLPTIFRLPSSSTPIWTGGSMNWATAAKARVASATVT